MRVASENPEVVAKYEEVKSTLEPFLGRFFGDNDEDEPDGSNEKEVVYEIEEECVSTKILTSIKETVKNVFEEASEASEAELTPEETPEVRKILRKADPETKTMTAGVKGVKDEDVVDGEMEIRQRVRSVISVLPSFCASYSGNIS